MSLDPNPNFDLDSQVRYIYLLSDPRSDTPIYVGQAKCVITRLGQHIGLVNHYNPKLNSILTELKAQFLIPTVKVLEVTTKTAATERERFFILHYIKLFPNLCNTALTKEKIIKIKKEKVNKEPKKSTFKEVKDPNTKYTYRPRKVYPTEEYEDFLSLVSDVDIFYNNN